MKKYKFKRNKLITALAIASLGLSSQFALAQDAASDDGSSDEVETVTVIGSRSHKPRSAADSPVPVDVLSADDLEAIGGAVDLTDSLRTLIPSYTATSATGDSGFVRSTSLRGTAPDQTLVLINGKRRHRSSVLQFAAPAAGNGAQGADVGLIPNIALKSVEVLRDGAASQYGSDAIAGVINFVMRDANEGGEVQIQYGQYYEGEQTYRVGINQGFNLNDKGFVNISLEYQSNDALSRGIQRADAQAIIDSGVVGVGADSPFGDAPLVQTWGRPESSATRFFLNSGYEVGDNGAELYARVGYADATGRSRFFYRNPTDDDDGRALIELIGLGYDGPLARTGYTPYLDGNQKDLSLVAGINGEYSNGTYYDYSVNFGQNEMDLFLTREINPGLGLTPDLQIPQMNFNTGGYKQKEINFNADFSKPISDSINLAYGAEWRRETFTQIAGERNSWIDLATGEPGVGVDGRISPLDAGTASRSNVAAYLDIEQDISDDLMLQYAVRFENFSDFGSTINGKFAGRYSISDRVTLRGAVSTGFRAPTPAQANIRTTISTVSNTTGLLTIEGLVPPTDPLVASVGGQPLTEEKSVNLSFGVTSEITDNTTVTLDFYKIRVNDRIYRTGDIITPDGLPISFYTNALDVEHSGLDLVITSTQDWSDVVSTDFAFAYSYNKIDVVNQSLVRGIQPVSDAVVEDIENNFPNNRFVLTANTLIGDDWNLLLRANYYGEHYDERGRINADVNPTALLNSVIYVDLELGYQVNDQLRLRFGGANIFDQFVDTIGPPNSNRLSVGLPYPRRSAANYEGGSWYMGATYTF